MAEQSAAEQIIATLIVRSTTLATCESLTGGLVAGELTAVPGSSAVFRGGLIPYATDLKTTLAGVDADEISRFGAVSEVTAIELARGAQRECRAEWAIATTGAAGPAELEGYAPGSVWIAIAGPAIGSVPSPFYSAFHTFSGSRDEVRRQTVAEALEMLLRAFGNYDETT